MTLSNFADFTADGGVVGAYRVGADWRFEINLEALQRTHLNIAAAALRLSQKPKSGARHRRIAMTFRQFFSRYSLARRATLITVLTLLAMLALAGLTLATLFLRAQIEHSRLSALTQANVASSTITAAVRFGGYDVIADSLRVFDTGPGHDSVAVFDRNGKLVAQVVAPANQAFRQPR